MNDPQHVEVLAVAISERGIAVAWNQPLKEKLIQDGQIEAVTQVILREVESALMESDLARRARRKNTPDGRIILPV